MCDTVLVMTRTNTTDPTLTVVEAVIPAVMADHGRAHVQRDPWGAEEFEDVGLTPGADEQFAAIVGTQALLGYKISQLLTHDGAWALVDSLEAADVPRGATFDFVVEGVA